MKVDTSTPVVVLACPHHGGLGMTRSLGRLGIPVFNVDSTRWAPASFSRYCRGRFVWDLGNSPAEKSVAKLVEVVRKIGRRCVLIPGTDRAALFVAEHAAALESWYVLPAQNRALTHSLCSKKEMLDLAAKHNVATPATIGLETRTERIESLKRIELPVIVKGLDGRARERYRKTKLIIRTRQQLLALYGWVGESDAPGLIAQEYIPGSEDTVWMFNGYFNARSECVAGFTGRKLRQCPVYTGVTSLGICQKNDAVEQAAKRLLTRVGYRGMVDMDFRYDARDGQYKLLDVNPRLGSTFRLFVSTEGLDVARVCYLDLTGQPVSSVHLAEGRKWVVEDFDVVSSLLYMLDGSLRFQDWVKSFLGVQESAFFAWDDLLPVLLMLRADAAQLIRRMRRGQGLSFFSKHKTNHIPHSLETGSVTRGETMATYPQEISVSEGPHSDAHRWCVPKAVGAKATKWPDAIALTAGAQVQTYQELDSQANRVAHYLRSLGVGPDVLVGVCLPRCAEMVVAALGILKAGAAYLPMDPAYPPDRLAFMLQDAQAPALITNRCIAGRLPASGCTIVDASGPEIDGQPDFAPRIEIMPDDLAYVIYTSGSTGRPKGVEITHGGLANLVSWHRQAFSLMPGDRASHLAGLGFDAAVWELWPYLATGASVHLTDEATRVSARLLRDWLLARKITISFVPTPLAERMLALEWPSETPLRILLTGGDTLHHYPPADLPFALVNNYGPTECAVVATSCPVRPEAHPKSRPPIGRPITNTRVYLLDEHLEPVPTGEAGEIYIGGAGVARGYHNLPSLTAQRFIRDPFSSEPGGRLYRTGDLGSLLPDGQIAFLRRIDDQIKIRGYRIEPNEIVSVLNQHQDVCESLVTACEDPSGDKRLVAYVVLAPDSGATQTALRDFLAEQLPEYMLPAAFVPLDAFPLTPHGKIDRAALPAPTAENTLKNGSVQAPGSAIEERLTGILATLLRVEHVGADENFFQMGGHSLLGAQVIAHVRDVFGVELSLRSLFDHPTAREMSTEIERLILTNLESVSGEGARSLCVCPEGANA
jgi:amino acid adenylation domain-containing protein